MADLRITATTTTTTITTEQPPKRPASAQKPKAPTARGDQFQSQGTGRGVPVQVIINTATEAPQDRTQQDWIGQRIDGLDAKIKSNQERLIYLSHYVGNGTERSLLQDEITAANAEKLKIIRQIGHSTIGKQTSEAWLKGHIHDLDARIQSNDERLKYLSHYVGNGTEKALLKESTTAARTEKMQAISQLGRCSEAAPTPSTVGQHNDNWIEKRIDQLDRKIQTNTERLNYLSHYVGNGTERQLLRQEIDAANTEKLKLIQQLGKGAHDGGYGGNAGTTIYQSGTIINNF